MEEWKFLLQKDGDRSWLPLDSPDVEILEGRYRIVARSSQPHADISIRICHLATEEEPPKRRLQKRSGRTNEHGLMVVVPFAHLQSGLWDFSCFLTDHMSELVEDTWRYNVRLRVAAPVGEEVDPEEIDQDGSSIDSGCTQSAPDMIDSPMGEAEIGEAVIGQPAIGEAVIGHVMSEPAINESVIGDGAAREVIHGPTVKELAALNIEVAQTMGVSMDRLVEMTEQLSHRLIEDVFREFNLTPTPEAPTPAASPAVPALEAHRESQTVELEDQGIGNRESRVGAKEMSDVEVSDVVTLDVSSLCFALEQDGLIASRGQTLTIAGRVDTQEQIDRMSQWWADPFLATASMGLFPGRLSGSDQVAGTTRSVDAFGTHESEDFNQESDIQSAIAQEIRIHLRNPQTSEILASDRQVLSSGVPPLPFAFSFDIPLDLTTHLIVGEVGLYGKLSDNSDHPALNRDLNRLTGEECGQESQDESTDPASDEAPNEASTVALITHAFTITVDPADLLEVLDKVHATLQEDNLEATKLPDLATQFSTHVRQEQKTLSLDLSFLNFTSSVRGEIPANRRESSSQPVAVATRPASAQSAGLESINAQATDTQVADTEGTDLEPAAIVKAQSVKPKILPPLLHRPDPEQSANKRLELPLFGNFGIAVTDISGSASGSPNPGSGSGSNDDPEIGPETPNRAGGETWADLEALFSRGSSLPDSPADLDSFGNPVDLVAMELGMEDSATQASTTQTSNSKTSNTQKALGSLENQGDGGIGSEVTGPKAISPEIDVETEIGIQATDNGVSTIPLGIRIDFQALNLQERFLGRLNALANDPELSDQLKQEPGVEGVLDGKDPLSQSETGAVESYGAVENLGEHSGDAVLGEVVVEDDPSWRDRARKTGLGVKSTSKSATTDEANTVAHSMALPVDYPVPVPVIEVLTEEVIAGLPINVRVKLPNLVPRIYVKLWVNDRQTRTLLDGPRWLVDFMPNGMGEVVAFTQLTAPFGSLGIRLEAIAVEMETQRESQKVGLDRTIEAEDVLDMCLDDLDF